MKTEVGLVAVGALCMAAAPVNADPPTGSETWVSDPVTAQIGSPATIEVPQFDTEGGCRLLQKITVVFDVMGSGNVSITNINLTDPCTVQAGTLTLAADLGGPLPCDIACDYTCAVPPAMLAFPEQFLAPCGAAGFPNCDPDATWMSDDVVLDNSCMFMSNPGDDLSAFIGAGTVTFGMDSSLVIDTVIECPSVQITDGTYTGTVTITYEFKTCPVEITCPPDVTVSCEDPTDPASTGMPVCSHPDPDCQDIGFLPPTFVDVVSGDTCLTTIERTWTCEDECGETASCVQIITVIDDIPPVITCPPDVTISCLESTDPSNTGEPTCTDSCSPVNPSTYTDVVSGDTCLATIERTWTCTDVCDNSDSCVQIITVVDDIPPVITCPPDVTINCLESTDPSNTGEPTCTDACSPVNPSTYTDVVSGDSCLTTIERTWTCTDVCDNSASCVQIITVADDTPPVINCPDDATIECGDTATYTITASDDCQPVVTISCTAVFDPPGSGTFTDNGDGTVTITFTAAGTVTITCTADDGCDNVSAPCTFTVTAEGFCIGDRIWNDLNQDGCQDLDEPGLVGVTVRLYRNCGTPEFLDETITVEDGFYEFCGLCPDDYLIEVIPPAEAIASPPNVECVPGDPGASDAFDSDCEGGMFCPAELDDTNDCGYYFSPLACRMTGIGNARDEVAGNRYTFGGQAGAPTAEQPQPYGEWTHHQKNGPDGRFIFHAGTASAPDGTEIDFISCCDEGWCEQARPAPAKQINFEGVGTFRNIHGFTPPVGEAISGETYHWFEVHAEDLGEPGGSNGQGHQAPPPDFCPEDGYNCLPADCDCPDFYRITIYRDFDPATEPPNTSDVIYEVSAYVRGGNVQIHPPVGETYPAMGGTGDTAGAANLGLPGGLQNAGEFEPPLSDLNADARVDYLDLVAVIEAMGQHDVAADLDGDGTVEMADVIVLLQEWSTTLE